MRGWQSWRGSRSRYERLIPESGNRRLSAKLPAQYRASRVARCDAEVSAVLEVNEETAEVLTNRTKVQGQSVDEYLKSLLNQNEKPIAPQRTSDAEFEADMEAFAAGTEHLQPYA